MTHVGQEALHQNWGFEVKPASLEWLAGALCGNQWNLGAKQGKQTVEPLAETLEPRRPAMEPRPAP